LHRGYIELQVRPYPFKTKPSGGASNDEDSERSAVGLVAGSGEREQMQ
jgi:hypothetical protein